MKPESPPASTPARTLIDVAKLVSWEVLEVADAGPGCCPGTRRYVLSTVATMDDGTLRPANVECSMSPEAMQRWTAAVGHGPVVPPPAPSGRTP